jgi:hypothetical protein
MLKNLHTSARVTRRDIVRTNSIIEKNSILSLLTHGEIEFERRNDLIYHLNKITSRTRLCILKSLIKEIFHMTHDEQAHAEFHRAHIIIFEILYIRRLAHYLRQYIEYCSECLLNQIKRHRSYDVLILIASSKISFHIIIMNFVLILSQSR